MVSFLLPGIMEYRIHIAGTVCVKLKASCTVQSVWMSFY